MTLTLTDVVWSEQRYEAGRYDCDVIRAGDHGRLSVHLVTDYDLILVHCELVDPVTLTNIPDEPEFDVDTDDLAEGAEP